MREALPKTRSEAREYDDGRLEGDCNIQEDGEW